MDTLHYGFSSLQALSYVQILAGLVIALAIYTAISKERPYKGIPVVTCHLEGWKAWLPSQFQYMLQGKGIMEKGLRECASCFQVKTGSGYKIIVPNRFAEELKNDSRLNFNESFQKELFVDYPGFEGNRQGLQDATFIQEVVRVKLTQSLGMVTDDLVEETDLALDEKFGDNQDWQTCPIHENLLHIVARLSSRVFLGTDLCRNERWLAISKGYASDTFMGAAQLRLFPAFLRPVVHWVLPTTTRLRKEFKDANELVTEEVERRRKRAEAALAIGEKPPKVADAIGWMVEMSKGRQIDYVAGQLTLSAAAIHTTSDATSKCIVQLCAHPEVKEQLRAEAISVLQTHGWSRVALSQLKLMDSFLKEVQRTKELSFVSMHRLVKQPIKLSDGTELPAGAIIMVSDNKTHDPSIYNRPDEFDPARYLRMREQPGQENRHQYVTTTSDHMGFGHGQHACPGRFFASNEIKILLCFLLLKYDFKSAEGESRPGTVTFEVTQVVDPSMTFQIRRRQEEIDLLDPQQKLVTTTVN